MRLERREDGDEDVDDESWVITRFCWQTSDLIDYHSRHWLLPYSHSQYFFFIRSWCHQKEERDQVELRKLEIAFYFRDDLFQPLSLVSLFSLFPLKWCSGWMERRDGVFGRREFDKSSRRGEEEESSRCLWRSGRNRMKGWWKKMRNHHRQAASLFFRRRTFSHDSLFPLLLYFLSLHILWVILSLTPS